MNCSAQSTHRPFRRWYVYCLGLVCFIGTGEFVALYFPIFHFARVCSALPFHIPKPNAAMLSTKSPSSSRASNSSQINSGLTSAVLLQVSTTSSVSCTTLSTTSSWVICEIDISFSIISFLNYLIFNNVFCYEFFIIYFAHFHLPLQCLLHLDFWGPLILASPPSSFMFSFWWLTELY